MLLFSGLNSDGNPQIFDYLIGTIHPDINPAVEYEFYYHGHDGPHIETTEITFPELDNLALN